jgi:curved DNA-binding protein CbpA
MAPVEIEDDYYEVLEISDTAALDVVTKSYRRLAKIYHPDKNRNDGSTAAFQLVNSTLFLMNCCQAKPETDSC